MLTKESLEQLIELARMRRERAARELGASQSRAQSENERLQLLLEYRKHYLVRFDLASRSGLDRATWSNYLEFIHRLDAAIEQQQLLLELCRKTVSQRRGDWQAQELKKKSFDALERRRQDTQLASERRREQREQDEFASRASNRESA